MRTGYPPRWWVVVVTVPVAVVALLVAAMMATRPPEMLGGAAASAGDPYYPDAGASGYDATSYTIALRWDENAQELSGTTRIEALATADLPTFHVDLAHAIDAAEVNGRPAIVTTGPGDDRAITPDRPLRAGQRFSAELTYTANPATLGGLPQDNPVRTGGGEMLIAGEPESSAAWFPANDHPTDPALMELLITVPAGREALSTGRLVSRDADADPATATWHWVADEPMATYLTFLAIGEFAIEESEADGRQVVYAVSEQVPADVRDRAWALLRRTPEVVRALEERYGPYPFSQLGGVVVGVDLWFDGLETQTRPVYAATLGQADAGAEGLLIHELAHMWFGDHVRVRTWDDIVNNEGWATFATNDLLTTQRGLARDAWLTRRWDGADARFWRPSLSDPGVDNMFGTTYARGAMALAALRNVLGDDAFAALARDWAQTPGARSLEEFQDWAEARAGRDLSEFWAAWYDAPTAPPRTPAYGYPAG